MTDQRQRPLFPLLKVVSPHSPSGTTLAPTHGARVRGESCRHTVTINMLPDEIFLEIFAFCLCHYEYDNPWRMEEWQRLVHVCRRWRQIIHGSPIYLDLLLHCSNRPVKKDLRVSGRPKFPIAMRYLIQVPGDEDDVLALLKHSDRVRLVDLSLMTPQWRNVAATMQRPFPVLTDLQLSAGHPGDVDVVVLPSGFLGGSAPRLQRLVLGRVPFPTLPTLLLSARNLVHLRYDLIPPTGYISPEAMVAGLAVLTRLESLIIQFYPLVYLPEQRRRCPEPSMRAVLPALTDFEFGGFGEYSEDFMAQIDAPRSHSVAMILHRFDCLRVHQLFLFIDRTENFMPSRVRVDLCDGHININLVAGHPSSRVLRPHFSFSTPLEWSNTQVAYLTLVLSRMSAVCSHVEYQYLAIYDCENRPGSSWHDYIDRTGWLAFFRQLTSVETLYIYGGLAAQVVRALEDVPGEMVTEVLPSLHSLWVDTGHLEVNLKPAEQFIALRRLYGRPVTICERHNWDKSFEGV